MPAGEQRVTVDGIRQLRSQLRKAGDNLDDFKTLNAKVAGTITTVARGRAPFDPRPGPHLFQTVRAGATKTQAVVRAGNNTTVPYANPIHWGWFARGIRPNPWVSRAAQETEPGWIEIYWAGLNKIIDRIKGRDGPP